MITLLRDVDSTGRRKYISICQNPLCDQEEKTCIKKKKKGEQEKPSRYLEKVMFPNWKNKIKKNLKKNNFCLEKAVVYM